MSILLRELFSCFFLLFIALRCISANEFCGVSKSAHGLVYGGESVKQGEHPWLVPLFNYKDDKFFCGSNLISHQHLLTVAHCIQDKQVLKPKRKEDFYAYVGRFDTTKTVIEPYSRKEDIKKISMHPKWSTKTLNYDSDIAVLTLFNRLEFNEFVQPVCLPGRDFEMGARMGSVVGFGKSELPILHEPKPKKIEIPSYTNDECFFTDFNFARFGSLTTFCAGEFGKSPCKGDSGSGFFIKEAYWRIGGLVAAAVGEECAVNKFVLFTNVAKFSDWIQEQMTATEDDHFSEFADRLDAAVSSPAIPEGNNLIGVDCAYKYSGSTYGCFANGLMAPDSDVQLVINNGQHKPGRTNRDVTSMHLKYGQISHFPNMEKVVESFPNLLGFGVTLNQMKYIKREDVKSLTKLKFFFISDNEIEVIPPDTFVDMRELELLDICRNKVKILEPNWISTMPKLRDFRARSNLFRFIPRGLFANNPQLEDILFDFNPIEKNYEDYMGLRRLKTLAMLKTKCVDAKYCTSEGMNCMTSLQQFQYTVNNRCGDRGHTRY